MSHGVLQRVLCSVPSLESGTLHVLQDPELYDVVSAVKKLGFDPVWRASLKACYFNLVMKAVRNSTLGPAHFAATGAAAADTAAWIAERHIVNPNEAFSLALWSECGLVASIYAFPDVYSAMFAQPGNRTISDLEREAFGFDHQLVGACVMRLYKFPKPFQDQCARHELDLLDLRLEEKLLRTATVAVATVGGWYHPKDAKPTLTAGVLAGALMREPDRDNLADFARSRLGDSMRLLATVQKKPA